jgi:large subunit ribosomal protein L21
MADMYAIIRLGNKQHRVRDGETLVVDRLSTDAGKSFQPDVLLGEGTVTATVIAHERGPKIRIGKYRRRTGYKRHNGHRSATSRVQIALGAAPKRSAAPKQEAAPQAEAPKAEAPRTEAPRTEAPRTEAPAGLPEGYEEMTVPQIKTASAGWTPDELEAALAYENEHAARKGAIAALESAQAKEES